MMSLPTTQGDYTYDNAEKCEEPMNSERPGVDIFTSETIFDEQDGIEHHKRHNFILWYNNDCIIIKYL